MVHVAAAICAWIIFFFFCKQLANVIVMQRLIKQVLHKLNKIFGDDSNF